MYKLVVFIPCDFGEIVKTVMFKAGAARIGNYDSCAFELKGQGQFRPLRGSNPFKGEMDLVEKIEELRVEMVCEKKYVKDVIKAMIEAHPYEEPAYDIIKLSNFEEFL